VVGEEEVRCPVAFCSIAAHEKRPVSRPGVETAMMLGPGSMEEAELARIEIVRAATKELKAALGDQ
jgi:hypothetical protein